jgi:hypothetical protein
VSRALALRAAAATVLLLAAAFVVLVALDAHAWGSRVSADDLRYRRDASAPRLWRVRELVPGGITRGLLGIGDDVAYRRGLRDFRLGRPTEPISSPQITTHRIAAQVELTRVADTATNPVVRSQVENLLGVLGFGLGSQDVGQRQAFFNNAIGDFRSAVMADPTNDDAYFNLEYALDQIQSSGEQQAQGSAQTGHRGNAGLKPPGKGY